MKIIAEIGGNHRGSFETAVEMIESLSYYCGVDVIKFQKRNNKELLTEEEYNREHPCPENSFGETYGEHRDKLEFNIEQHKELKKYCEKLGVIYSCSVWDITSAKDIISLNPKMIKIPSAQNYNLDLLNYIADNYNGEIHISLGMTTKEEQADIYSLLKDKNKLKNTVLYHCISDYPVSLNNVCLKEIEILKNIYQDEVRGFGFSGHHEGLNIDNLCYAMGVDYIERHFTINKNWRGTDHSASLEPDEMRALVKIIKDCQRAFKVKDKEILDCELVQRNKLKRFKK